KSWKVKERAGDRGFTIHDRGGNLWQISAGSSNGSRRKPMLTALSLEEAVLGAARILYPQDSVDHHHPHLDLAEAFNLAIKQSYAGAEGKALLYRNAGYFLEWAEKREIYLWEQVRLDHVHEYAQFLIAKRLSCKTIKGYLEPVKATGKRVVAVYPDYYKDPCYAFRLPRRIGAPKTVDEKIGKRSLTIREVILLYEHLMAKKGKSSLSIIVLLCGLLGIRVREALFLSWKNVNLDGSNLRIEEEQEHLAKTVESVRLIPLPAFVLDELRKVRRKGSKVIDLGSLRNRSSDLDDAVGKRYMRTARKWNPERYVCLSDLRNTLLNTARRNASWPVHLVEQYVGHVDSNVTGKHYQSTDPLELFGLFKNKVIPLLDEEIKQSLEGTKWQQNACNNAVNQTLYHAQIIDISDLTG
ncbi:MAG: tyrosine-type recombinase/integrase, partial [Sumerlaeia bacterium]